ncbi:hypothetical protein HNR45_000054 [Negativicoccus succinicivorans]|uniref:Uncharacterized protein n=1 Tax=Negativicoccus succinicivorans TaxID=620903 RepID=A0A841R356_9FIRM|nr:hypothetical protein [Negativicoccus succinicivorans]MBB6477032.1 hypothetical protein [Negativicoccus succinicivorans]
MNIKLLEIEQTNTVSLIQKLPDLIMNRYNTSTKDAIIEILDQYEESRLVSWKEVK